jgi:guanylate cyclase
MNRWMVNHFSFLYPPDCNEQYQVRYSLAIIASLATSLSVGFYAIVTVLYGETLAGLIWLGWALYNFLAMIYTFHLRRLVTWTFVLQAAFCLLVPLVVGSLLGGYIRMGYFGFALMAPIVALIWVPQQFWGWLLGYVGMSILCIILDPYLTLTSRLPGWFVSLWFCGAMLVSGLMALLMIWYLLKQRDDALARLAEEQARSEALLLNVLPESIAQRLKMNPFSGQLIADQTEEASILFADVVNFTPLSAQISPQELIGLLDRLFTRFDALTDQFGLEKIKTVGDCYMVAAGVPTGRSDHAVVITRLALAIQQAIGSEKRPNGEPLTIRIGINSGAVVAGVIGRKKFIYDLWGDAVNIASRMESHGHAGVVQVTRATYERIRDHFICEAQGLIEIKGKGPMEVWHVIAERTL